MIFFSRIDSDFFIPAFDSSISLPFGGQLSPPLRAITNISEYLGLTSASVVRPISNNPLNIRHRRLEDFFFLLHSDYANNITNYLPLISFSFFSDITYFAWNENREDSRSHCCQFYLFEYSFFLNLGSLRSRVYFTLYTVSPFRASHHFETKSTIFFFRKVHQLSTV